ncbi:MAG TPA: ArsC family reductase [Daejeonella sp.]|nr:ArsC family reductase [Daejeonella sp.]
MKIYGIPNCNTVKKALDWLKANQIDFEFHDFKKLGISESKLKTWADELGWESLINKRGTTWKKLDLEVQHSITTPEAAFALMQDKTSVIKRPVLETNNGLLLGFDGQAYSELLAKYQKQA